MCDINNCAGAAGINKKPRHGPSPPKKQISPRKFTHALPYFILVTINTVCSPLVTINSATMSPNIGIIFIDH